MDPEPQAGDTLVDLLDQLQDIVEPPPVSMAPATWGWAAVAAILLGVVALAAWAWLRRRRATAYRRAALAELRALAPALERGEPGALAGLDALIRRTALVAFPRAEVATLTGDAWLAFLRQSGGSFAASGAALAAGPYAPCPPAVDGAAALAEARRWIVGHHA